MTPRRAHRTASTTHRLRTARAVLGAACLLAACAGTAQAQSSPYYVAGSLTYSHDSNLLRLTDGSLAPADYSKADSVLSTALLAGLDQNFGRQRAFGNVTLRSNRYSSNTLYNNDSYAFSGGLDWSTAERLSGQVSANASRNLSSFNLQEIGLLSAKNQESSQGFDAMLRVGLVTEYSIEASGGHREIKNSLDDARVQARNYTQDTASLGLRWRPSPDTVVGVGVRSTHGRYPKFRPVSATEFESDRFKRNDVDLSFWHRPSGASSVDLRLSTGKTTYDLATQRNFSGLTGSLGWNWRVSSKVNLTTRLSHDTGQDSYAVTTFFGTPGTADYSRVNTALRIKADYELAPKVALNMAVAQSNRDIVRSLDDIFGPREATGRERYTTVSLGARWAPHRSVQVGCDAGQETRKGTGALGSDLSANTYNCFAQFTLQ
jgi:hypothetical protein